MHRLWLPCLSFPFLDWVSPESPGNRSSPGYSARSGSLQDDRRVPVRLDGLIVVDDVLDDPSDAEGQTDSSHVLLSQVVDDLAGVVLNDSFGQNLHGDVLADTDQEVVPGSTDHLGS